MKKGAGAMVPAPFFVARLKSVSCVDAAVRKCTKFTVSQRSAHRPIWGPTGAFWAEGDACGIGAGLGIR